MNRSNITKSLLLLVIFVLFIVSSGISANRLQADSSQEEGNKREYKERKFNNIEERSKLKYRFVPTPSYDPSTEWGLSLINLFTYYPNKLDTISPASTTSAALMVTSNGSWLVGGAHNMFLNEDRWRIAARGGYGKLNQTLVLGDEGDAEVKRIITIVVGEVSREIINNLYGGLGVNYKRFEYVGRDEESQGKLDRTGFGESDGSIGIKYLLSYDSRDNIFYPYRGGEYSYNVEQYFATSSAEAFASHNLDLKHFISLDNQNQSIVGMHLMGRFLTGEPQQENYSFFGRQNGEVQRGYESGSYIDKNLVNVEVEYRRMTRFFDNRVGYNIFTSVGSVYGDIDTFKDASLLYAYGAGLRYQLLPYERLNIKMDASWGRDGFVWYFGLREAF